jgi:hypothetical protein
LIRVFGLGAVAAAEGSATTKVKAALPEAAAIPQDMLRRPHRVPRDAGTVVAARGHAAWGTSADAASARNDEGPAMLGRGNLSAS